MTNEQRLKKLSRNIKRLISDNDDMDSFTLFVRCKFCTHLSPEDFCCHVCGFDGDDENYSDTDKALMRAGKNPKNYRKD